MNEKRNFQRVPFATGAAIACQGKKYHGELLDISLQGALVLCKGKVPLVKGSRCQLSVHLLDTEIIMQFEADIVHHQDNRLGFKFMGIDTETATHLRRLLELNIGSSEALDRELALWLKEK